MDIPESEAHLSPSLLMWHQETELRFWCFVLLPVLSPRITDSVWGEGETACTKCLLRLLDQTDSLGVYLFWESERLITWVTRQTATCKGSVDRTLKGHKELGVEAGKDAWKTRPMSWALKKGSYLTLERCMAVSSTAPLGRTVFLLLTQHRDASFSVLTAHQLR